MGFLLELAVECGDVVRTEDDATCNKILELMSYGCCVALGNPCHLFELWLLLCPHNTAI